MNTLRIALNEAAVLGDSLAWKLGARGLFAPGGAFAPPRPKTRWARTLPRPRDPRPAEAAARFKPKPGLRRAVLLWGSGLAALAVSATVWVHGETARLLDLRLRLGAITVIAADGVALGALPRADKLTGRDASGRETVRIATSVAVPPLDFLRASKAIEGTGVLGVSPHNLLRSAVCYGAAGAGLRDATWLRLKDGRCAGASTLLAQSVRSLTNDRRVTLSRKASELLSTLALAGNLSGAEQDRLIADTLYFGDAEGLPIIGLENAARVVFGKPATALELHESAYLSALLLIPARLSCGGAGASAARFEDQVERARMALNKGFKNDPRLAIALNRLASLSPIGGPAPDRAAMLAGRSASEACRAGANPLLRFEVLDSSARLALREELAAGPAGRVADRAVLTYRWADQARFKTDIGLAQAEIAARQRGQWLSDPRGAGVVTLAFTADPQGAITGLHESSAVAQLYRPHELGSLAKLPALAFLAGRGWGERQFCNRQAWLGGKQLHNAGGDPGVPRCVSVTGMRADEVWGRSLSLAVYDALRSYDDGSLRAQMQAWRIELPAQSSAAYALAFGLARATPADFAAFLAALSAGNLGRPALGYRPHLLQQVGPAEPAIDLGDVFARPGAAALIARASGAALSYHGTGGVGTLAGLGAAPPGAVAKSGTLDDDAGHVRYKAAAGGLGGATWAAMVFPARGALGKSHISIIPLAKVAARQASFSNGR